MPVHPDAEPCQALCKRIGSRLAAIPGDHDAADKQLLLPERIDQPEHLRIIGDIQIVSDLVALNIARMDGKNDLRIVPQCLEHIDFAVG